MNASRRCRDVLFLLLFIGFWVGMFIVCGIAFKRGDANRLVYGQDKYGLRCGTKNTIGGVSVRPGCPPDLPPLAPPPTASTAHHAIVPPLSLSPAR